MPRDEEQIDRVRTELQDLAEAEPELVSREAAARLDAVFEATEDRDRLHEASVGRPPKEEADRKAYQTAIRLNAEDVEALDELARLMSETTGLEVTRAAAMRLAIKEGVAALRGKYSPRSKPKK